MPYKRQSPLSMMVAGKKQLEKDNPPPTMVSLVQRDAEGNPIQEVRGGSGLLGFIGGNAISAGKQLLSGASRLFRSFTNAPKQYMKPYKVGGKTYGHFTKDGKLTNKYVPVVGKPGKKVKVNNPNTKQVSYANPRISMTPAERAKAGY